MCLNSANDLYQAVTKLKMLILNGVAEYVFWWRNVGNL